MNDINHRKEVHLLEKCLNEGQCEDFVRQYWNLIYYMVKKLFLQRNYPFSEMDLEDMVGDVFVQIFQDNCRKLRLYNKEKGTKISVWISIIVQSTVSNFFRKKEIDCISDSDFYSGLDNLIDFSDTCLEKNVISKIDIEKALETLSSKDQVIIKLLAFKGLSASEVGQILHMKERSVNNRKVHIKKNLASYFLKR
jgi:RNA polymerase sigma factor (sigma-70 family)